MALYIKGNGRIVPKRVKAICDMLMGLNSKETSKMIFHTDMARNNLVMVLGIQVNLVPGCSTGKVNSGGQMEASLKANGRITR